MQKIKLFFLVFFLINFSSHAQCAMCKAVAESSQNSGSSIANGLNTGILYLMIFPYILLLFGLISLYFRNQKTN
ncbi:MAG: hypothetical protein CMP56_01130 [Flavobacteriales bacterium]|jgi:hypothetical protein|nr:hypothetical protein [Flavobacteriales bacterium]|tara:strand:- start:812 stop:1033 length:222 start_codon:yes stop_codon:yes gene_type:complete